MSLQKEDKKNLIQLAFPQATLKRIVTKHKIRKETRISKEGLEQLNETLDELTSWIILEAEKLAINEGKLTITSRHINEAFQIYFGKRV